MPGCLRVTNLGTPNCYVRQPGWGGL